MLVVYELGLLSAIVLSSDRSLYWIDVLTSMSVHFDWYSNDACEINW